MTMEEMQSLLGQLRPLFTDVRLLGATDVHRIVAGGYTSAGPNICYACGHKRHFSRHCAAVRALQTRQQQSVIEVCGRDVLQITAYYYEVDGAPYVLETVQRSSCQATLDVDNGERIMRELSGYNTKLYRDALTGVYNRCYYEEVASKTPGPSFVVVMDLDDFKICNDTYGHHAGDLALKAATRAIRTCIRSSDPLIRYGGDEFLLILHGIPLDYVQIILERMRVAVQSISVPGFPHLRMSLSIGGVAQGENESMPMAVQRADRLMYQAKLCKNIVVSPDSQDTSAPALTTQTDASSSRIAVDYAADKPRVLIVDDSAMNRELLTEMLQSDYHILEAENGQICIDTMQDFHGDIALVLLDINMPVLDGFDVLKMMNASHAIEDIPVIMISSEDSEAAIRRAYELGASDYINRPFDARVVSRRVYNTIKLYAKQRRLVRMVSDQIRAREKNTTLLVGVLSQIVEFRNGESGTHVRHIQIITELLLNRLLEVDGDNLAEANQDDIPLASALHDIGKIAIDEHILNKPGRLTAEEFAIMQTHCVQGADMLHRLDNFENEPLLRTAYEIARWHHERWDGRGYPDGLKGDEIPISAQIVSLADVYDALTSKRCYKEAYSHEKAMRMILGGECGAFNPLLLQCLQDIQLELRTELAL